jgi:hypothetical protein
MKIEKNITSSLIREAFDAGEESVIVLSDLEDYLHMLSKLIRIGDRKEAEVLQAIHKSVKDAYLAIADAGNEGDLKLIMALSEIDAVMGLISPKINLKTDHAGLIRQIKQTIPLMASSDHFSKETTNIINALRETSDDKK